MRVFISAVPIRPSSSFVAWMSAKLIPSECFPLLEGAGVDTEVGIGFGFGVGFTVATVEGELAFSLAARRKSAAAVET